MKGKSTGKKKGIAVVAVILIVLIVALIINRELVRGVFFSVWDPKVKLDVSGDWAGGTAYRNMQYSDVSESDYLNLYVPDSEDPVPLIVIVHGGGFVANDCESRQAQLFYQYFRDHGYACATVNYRLAQEAPFPAAVEDVKSAVRYLRANADQYGYTTDKLAIWGESAGGYLAVMAGVTSDEEFNSLPFIGEEELDEPVSAQVSVILDYYGATALESGAERRAAFRDLGIYVPGVIDAVANAWLTEALKDYPEFESVEDLWLRKNIKNLTAEERQVFLPAYYIQKNFGPDSDLDVLIWHGDADITVPWTQSQHLYERLCSVIGEDRVSLRYFHNCKHAAEKMFSDESLGQLKEYLDGIVGA